MAARCHRQKLFWGGGDRRARRPIQLLQLRETRGLSVPGMKERGNGEQNRRCIFAPCWGPVSTHVADRLFNSPRIRQEQRKSNEWTRSIDRTVITSLSDSRGGGGGVERSIQYIWPRRINSERQSIRACSLATCGQIGRIDVRQRGTFI